jgi:hypothetical protein
MSCPFCLPDRGIDARPWLRMFTPDFSVGGWLGWNSGASCTPWLLRLFFLMLKLFIPPSILPESRRDPRSFILPRKCDSLSLRFLLFIAEALSTEYSARRREVPRRTVSLGFCELNLWLTGFCYYRFEMRPLLEKDSNSAFFDFLSLSFVLIFWLDVLSPSMMCTARWSI